MENKNNVQLVVYKQFKRRNKNKNKKCHKYRFVCVCFSILFDASVNIATY